MKKILYIISGMIFLSACGTSLQPELAFPEPEVEVKMEVEVEVEVEETPEVQNEEQEFSTKELEAKLEAYPFYELRNGEFHYMLLNWDEAGNLDEEWVAFPGIDLTSLEVLNSLYFMDEKNVYYFGMLPRKVEGADPSSFEVFGHDEMYDAKDANSVYIEYLAVDEAAIQQVDEHYWTDGVNVFTPLGYSTYPERILEGADGASFVSLGGGFAKDARQVYSKCLVWEGMCVSSIIGADPASFELMDSGFSKDVSGVYFYTHTIDQANPNHFKLLQSSEDSHMATHIAVDDSAMYAIKLNSSQRFTDVDLESLEVLDMDYYENSLKDANGEYSLVLIELDEMAGEFEFTLTQL